MPLSRRILPLCVASLLSAGSLFLSGCAFESERGIPSASAAISGKTYGGQQPVVGASIYMYAAATSGYGASSTSLLQPGVNNVLTDGNGLGYVKTDASGGFSITGDWSCTAGTQVYLISVGGNPGGYGVNPNGWYMTALGDCSALSASTFIWMNEVTTVASVYALSGFMSSPTQVASASSTASISGLKAAFATVNNLVNTATGAPAATTAGGNGVVPVKNINTLANVLAACENSTGGANNDGTICGTLFNLSTPSGGNAPTNTIQAALNLAHNPALNPSDLYNLMSPVAPFYPSLDTAPYDWTMPIVFSGGGLSNAYDIAIDGNNNVWIANDGRNGNCAALSASTGSAVTKLSNLGAVLSGTNGYTSTQYIGCPFGIAIDTSNNAWVVNDYVNYLTKVNGSTGAISQYTSATNLYYANNLAFDSAGYIWMTNYTNAKFPRYSPTANTWTSYTGGGITASGGGVSWGIAMDGLGHVFVASNSQTGRVAKFNSTATTVGAAVTTTSGYTGAGMTYPLRLAVDQGNNVWVANFGASAVTAPGTSISKIANDGTAISSTSGFTGGGLYAPFGIAVDGGNHVWVANAAAYSVSEFDNDGNALSPYYGFLGTPATTDTAAMYFPEALAIDQAGNVWVANYGVNSSSGTTATVQATVTELVGAATPTLTPIAAATAAGKPASKP